MAYEGIRRAPRLIFGASIIGACLLPNQASAGPGDPACVRPPASALVVDVTEKGAKPGDLIEDTAAIQAAIDQVAGTGGTVLVPDGTYLVNAVGKHRLTLKSRMTLELAPHATLKAIPNGAEGYAVLSISGASDVTVVGGTLEGDREAHAGTTGEWGMGIRIDGGSQRITVSGVTATKMWGDGFYVHGAKGVLLCQVTADHNRRQGLSVIQVDGLIVTGSVFKNTRGTRPGSGIDLEPDVAAEEITNVRIESSRFLDNAGAGLLIHGGKGPISKVEITNNVFAGNPRSIKLKHVPGVSARCGNQIVSQSNSWTDFSALVELATYAVASNDCDD
jgi:polygalacturonase